jgi:flagellar biosynthesis protein FliR
MPNEPEIRPEATVLELVSGIILDVHVLIRQQLALFQLDIRGEIGRAVRAGSLVTVGLAVAVIGSGLLCVMLVHLLARMAPGLPLWGCYGIVGSPVALLGGVLCMAGIQRLRHFPLLTVEPDHNHRERTDG